jgi:transmembrane sensor
MTTQWSVGDDSTEVAVRWYRRLAEGDLSTLPLAALTEWTVWSAEPQHLAKFREVKRVWHASAAECLRPELPSDAEIAADEYDGSVSMSEWLATEHPSLSLSKAAHKRNPGSFRRFTKLFAIAAGLITLGALLGLYEQQIFRRFQDSRTYSTDATEQRLLSFPDGVTITLAPGTALTTHFTSGRREVVLERGEAWFKVTHNPVRPFTVFAGTGAIAVLGTQFDVRLDRDDSHIDHVTVAVGYGAVEVQPPSKESISQLSGVPTIQSLPNVRAAKLVQGQEITYDTAGFRGGIKEADLEAIAAWKQVRLEYEQTPLKVVIAEVNRYSDKPIVLSDSEGAVGELPFSGTVFELQIPGWLQALQATYPVEVTEQADRFIVRLRQDPSRHQ